MTVPNLPWAVQLNVSNSDVFDMWSQSDSNLIATRIKRLEIDRWSTRGSGLRGSTCTVTAYDPDLAFRPGKDSSPLAPNVQLGMRARVLAQTSPGTYRPKFFGYLRSIEPNVMDPNPPEVTLTFDSPLITLADTNVTLPSLTQMLVYQEGLPLVFNALPQLFLAVNLWNTVFVDFDDVGHVRIPGTWGGTTKTFGQWLTELCDLSGCLMSDDPRYMTTADGTDFVFHWYRPPVTATSDFTLSAEDGDLQPTPQIQFNADTPG